MRSSLHSVAGSPPSASRPRLQHIAPVRDLQRHMRVLLDQQHRRPALMDFADDLEYRLHDDRREAERGLVEQQQPGLRHQAARDRDHLLLAAGERPAELVGERPDIGKEVEHRVGLAADRGARGVAVRGAEHDVLAHAEAGKDAPPFGHMGDAELYDRARPEARDRLAVEQDLSRRAARPGRRSRAGWSTCRRRWSRAARRRRLRRS